MRYRYQKNQSRKMVIFRQHHKLSPTSQKIERNRMHHKRKWMEQMFEKDNHFASSGCCC
jgi:hypothetical protein